MHGLLWKDNLAEIQLFEYLESEGAKKKKKIKIDIYGEKFTKYLHGTWFLLNILTIFGMKEKSIILTHTCIVGYCYKYTCATQDWFCAPGSHMSIQNESLIRLHFIRYCLNREYTPSELTQVWNRASMRFVCIVLIGVWSFPDLGSRH